MNISPSEIEDVLIAPAVIADVAALGTLSAERIMIVEAPTCNDMGELLRREVKRFFHTPA